MPCLDAAFHNIYDVKMPRLAFRFGTAHSCGGNPSIGGSCDGPSSDIRRGGNITARLSMVSKELDADDAKWYILFASATDDNTPGCMPRKREETYRIIFEERIYPNNPRSATKKRPAEFTMPVRHMHRPPL